MYRSVYLQIQYLVKFTLLFSLTILISGCEQSSSQKQIGIVMPIAHESLDQIVAGFVDALKKQYPQAHFKIANAQGDLNIQRAILQQMKNERYDLIVPVTTSPTQMAAAMIPHVPIIGLAAVYTEADRQKKKICNINIVHDEIPVKTMLHFIHTTYPELKQMTLLYTPSDKIFDDAKKMVIEGKNLGMTITPLMIPSLQELYGATQSLKNPQAILVLKDPLLVSGIATIVQAAHKRGIPLITSDEGSVKDGADFALGVREQAIGMEGAAMATKVLSGTSICTMPMVDMKHFLVFVNKKSFPKNNLDIQSLETIAKKFHYPVRYLGDQ
ncbi:MAG: ABC transporter substrate-binding protein [Gammaproteobacteria bacterium]|nr:ABC transporter substrate-binding protein [Gammaproteobacteria bacterium]